MITVIQFLNNKNLIPNEVYQRMKKWVQLFSENINRQEKELKKMELLVKMMVRIRRKRE